MLELKRDDGTTASNIEPADGIADDDLQTILTADPKAVTITDKSAPAAPGETLADRLLTRYAQHIEAGDLADLEAARAVLTHPAFGHTINRVNADADYKALAELSGKLGELEAAPLDELNPKIAASEREIEKMEAAIEVLLRKLAGLKSRTQEMKDVARKHQHLQDRLPTTFHYHPFLAYVPSILARLKALNLRAPIKPNYPDTKFAYTRLG